MDEVNNNICNYDSLVEELLSDSDEEEDDDVLYLADEGQMEDDADTAIDSDDLNNITLDSMEAEIPEEGLTAFESSDCEE